MKFDDSLAAIVTGGASGLGEAAVRALATESVAVTIFDLNAGRGAAVSRETARTVGKENAPHPLELFRKVIEVNLIGTFNVTSRVAARKGGVAAASRGRSRRAWAIRSTPCS